MSLTFPLSLAAFQDSLPRHVCRIELDEPGDLRSTPLAGRMLLRRRGMRNFTAVMNIPQATIAEAQRILALVDALDGGRNLVLLYDSMRKWPKADRGGGTLGASTVTVLSVGTNNKSLALEGLPAGYVISAGDRFTVTWSGRVALFQAAETVTANGSGETAEFEVSPHIHAGIAAGDSVTLGKAAARFQTLGDTLERGETFGNNVLNIAFAARMVLA